MPTIHPETRVGIARYLQSLPDADVIALVRDGEIQAYELIMRRYNQRLYRVARSILKNEDDAEDAVQEAYITAFFKLDSYQPRGNFSAWLTRITINEALMAKRKSVRSESDKSVIDAALAPRSNPADVMANKELAILIERAVDTLPQDFRIVFIFRAVQQLSVRETAECLNIKEATVKTRYLRARHQMQLVLNEHIEDAGLHTFEFAGRRCDNMVNNVIKRLSHA